ncbi:MAG: GNAT family N-acetyltransferase [Ruminococcaceae bacterium]|nr:GNAT family N-acetyltransferase [Oscillospiraceae bacterium]
MIFKPDISFCKSEELFTKTPYLTPEEVDVAKEYLYSDFSAEECEVRYAIAHFCFIFRYYSEDTGYYFSAPYSISERSDTAAAYAAVAEYCRLEEIPRVIIDVLPEELDVCIGGAKDYDASELDDGTYIVSFYTECMRLEDLPEAMEGDIYLAEPVSAYSDAYCRLISDKEHNKYYGYDAAGDISDLDGEEYVELVRSEFDRRVSMTYAATVLDGDGKNLLVGEAALYGFDGEGHARAAFRVLREHTRRGYGRSILRALVNIARGIGLHSLICEVMQDNAPSLALLSSMGYSCAIRDGIAVFEIPLA